MTPQLALEPLRMNAAKVIEAFYNYARDTDDTPRQTATRIGVPIKTLRAWLEGQAQPTKRLTLRLAGFLRRVGYI
jgi:outer membrane biogenesis lipoprotein LolB